MYARHPVLALLATGIATGGIAACGSQTATNKAGAAGTATRTLRLAMPDVGDLDGRFFAAAVKARSDGRLKVDLDDEYDSSDTRKEARLAPDAVAGKVDAVYMPARDWSAPGLPDFQALAAPFSVTTQAAMQNVAKSDFADHALASLRARHVIGLGLIPVEPRQLVSRRPLVSASDFKSASVRIVLDPAVGKAMTALGATATDEPDAARVGTLLAAGKLTGAETSPQYALSNGYSAHAPYLTSFGLYAKFQVIGIGERVWSKLDDSQKQALRDAAADTLEHAQTLPAREAKELAAVCGQKAVVTRTSPNALSALVAATQPDDSAYASAAKALSAVAGTGPQPNAVPIPSGCAQARNAGAALTAYRRATATSGSGLPASETATIPDGTYATTDTVKDWHKGGQDGADWNTPITWTWRLKAGRFSESQKPDFPDQGPCGGSYTIKGDQVTIHYTRGSCTALGDEVTRWSFYNGRLSFRVVEVGDTASRVIYSAHPWRKVG